MVSNYLQQLCTSSIKKKTIMHFIISYKSIFRVKTNISPYPRNATDLKRHELVLLHLGFLTQVGQILVFDSPKTLNLCTSDTSKLRKHSVTKANSPNNREDTTGRR